MRLGYVMICLKKLNYFWITYTGTVSSQPLGDFFSAIRLSSDVYSYAEYIFGYYTRT